MDSTQDQSLPRYAYLGPAGTFTEAALRQIAPVGEAEYLPQPDVVSAIEAVRRGDADYAVVPIENSVEGGVNATIDTISNGGSDLMILGEALVNIDFVLAARDGVTLDDVERVSTHPHAWAQCRKWVKANLPDAVHVPATSTAAAGEILARDDEASAGFDAALVAPLTAELYNLNVLASGVADNPDAVTRFIQIGSVRALPERTGADKTTLLVQLPSNESGALLTVLEQFAVRGVNMSRIESRPIGDSLGRYAFSIDLEGHIEDARISEALIGLHRVSPLVKFLGSYPNARREPVALLPATRDEDFAAGQAWVAAIKGRR